MRKILGYLPWSCCFKAKDSKCKEIKEVSFGSLRSSLEVGMHSNAEAPATDYRAGPPLPSTLVPPLSQFCFCFPRFQLPTAKVNCGPEADDPPDPAPCQQPPNATSPYSLSSPRHLIISCSSQQEGHELYRYFPRDHIHVALITGHRYDCSILLPGIGVNLSLCLTDKVDFITGLPEQGKTQSL